MMADVYAQQNLIQVLWRWGEKCPPPTANKVKYKDFNLDPLLGDFVIEILFNLLYLSLLLADNKYFLFSLA